MSVLKRSVSTLRDDEDEPPSKTSKTIDTAEAKSADLFEVEIKVPSAIKASRNDYQPPSSAQLKVGSIFSGDVPPPLTEEERQEPFGGPPRDLAGESGQAAALRNHHAVLGEMRSTDSDSPSHQQSDKTANATKEISNDGDSGAIDDYELREKMRDEDNFTSNSNFDEYEEFDWFEAINGNIHLKQAEGTAKQDPVGFCSSALIRRGKIHRAFHHEIQEPTEESCAMGFALFDRYGRLKPAFKKHPFKSGSGIWGDELDTGDIHLIDQVHIVASHRQKGLGKMLLEAVLEKGISKSDPHTCIAIARDAVIPSNLEHEGGVKTEEENRATYDRQRHISRLFLRSLGFRRIGSTEWFARAGDKKHPCHGLPADQDFDRPSTFRPVPTSIMNTLMKDLKALMSQEAQLDAVKKAFESCMPNDTAWMSTDINGNTLLHCLADSGGPSCVKWVLSRCPKLADVRNAEGNTALESFEEHLEVNRTQKDRTALIQPVSDKFSGYSELAIETLEALRGLSNPAPQESLRLKYGCTCGQCQFGFLSPRMHFVLLARAEIEHDMLCHEATDGDMFVDSNKSLFGYLLVRVRDKFRTNKSMREGFSILFFYFAECLRKKDFPGALEIFHLATQAGELLPLTKNYLDGGGTIEAVGSALFEKAMHTSFWAGDGSTEDDFRKDIEMLPACRNDDEFGFVSGMFGYKRVSGFHYVSRSGCVIAD